MRKAIYFAAVVIVFMIAGSAHAAGGECIPGVDVSGCVLIYEPPPDGGSGGGCAPAKDYNSCLAHCDCVYKENLDECDGKIRCITVAQAEQRACKTNCIADWP
jgi:hypothetical protein